MTGTVEIFWEVDIALWANIKETELGVVRSTDTPGPVTPHSKKLFSKSDTKILKINRTLKILEVFILISLPVC